MENRHVNIGIAYIPPVHTRNWIQHSHTIESWSYDKNMIR